MPGDAPVLAPPTPLEIRDEIESIVLRDLLGPAGPEDEELPPDVLPRDRYLVGMLAPSRQEIVREEMDELAQGGAGNSDEGQAEPGAPQARTLFPSSLGLSFCLADAEPPELKVNLSWGRYERYKPEEGARVWKRVPYQTTVSLTPREGAIGPISLDPSVSTVELRGLARKKQGLLVVTLFVVNNQAEPAKTRDRAWLFQVRMQVESLDQQPVFLRRPRQAEQGRIDAETWCELQEAERLYRHTLEFAVGHGVSVHAETRAGDLTRALTLETRAVPFHDVPMQTPPTAEEEPELARAVVDMAILAELPDGGFGKALNPLAHAYSTWIELQERRLASGEDGLTQFQSGGQAAIESCRRALKRIEEGLALLDRDPNAARAFRFANRAMALQRVRTLYSHGRRRGLQTALADYEVPANRSWRAFQLAFLLLNLTAVTDPLHPDRSHATEAVADLLWFPTGGGKTEAYLGLAAYAMALRRLQPESGQAGVSVLMRYTLRLLTLQQFQRAATLICACETMRRQDSVTWGSEPFRIGLWVGSAVSPNTTRRAQEAMEEARGNAAHSGRATPLQLTSCPWCGEALTASNVKVRTYEAGDGRTLVHCGNNLGGCEFGSRLAPDEGIPVVVVDEEIYRRLPALLISTVDKFAQMAWNGATAMLFGRVTGRCPRHGWRSPDLEDKDSHPAKNQFPAVRSVPSGPLRPPDLIIQDELHLISGPLGTLVGLYETAVDELCCWEHQGQRVRPKLIASTATIRRAQNQVRQLFNRRVEIFPPPGLDVEDNFFSRARPPSVRYPGRRYIGVCAPGIRVKTALLRVYVAFLGAAQQLFQRYGQAADPWMTLVGYFNSIRELGGMRRLTDDQVRARLRRVSQWGLAERRTLRLEELTSRLSSDRIPKLLDQLEMRFTGQKGAQEPLDVVLATNMISVGVDIPRLGLMVAAGQPKSTAEYIQATSRVGRQADGPGLVCTVYNWARPRDLSHYETFEHYHATFYQHVEALSVTPFAPRALDRGLTSVLVSLVRLLGEELNPNRSAGQFSGSMSQVTRAIESLLRRAGPEAEQLVRSMLDDRVASWDQRILRTKGVRLAYQRSGTDTVNLLQMPGPGWWDEWTVLNSMRDVEPPVNLVLAEKDLEDNPD